MPPGILGNYTCRSVVVQVFLGALSGNRPAYCRELQQQKDVEEPQLGLLIKGGYRAEVRREREKRDYPSPVNVL